MGIVTEGVLAATTFLHATAVPRGWETPLTVLAIYSIHLLVTSLILYFSVKLVGGGVDFISGFPKALFTTFIRDMIAVPLLFIAFFIPFFGIIIAIVVWLALVKYIFGLPWTQTLLAFIVSLILPIVILLFILLPIALILL